MTVNKIIFLYTLSSSILISSYKPIELITNTLDDHIGMFNIQHERNFTRFLKKELPNYPMPIKPGFVPTNPLERNKWLNNQFDEYVNTIKHKSAQFAQELKLFNNISTNILININKIIDENELQKLLEYPHLHQIKMRFKHYRKLYNISKTSIDQKFKKNIDIESDPLKGPTTLSEYKQRHRSFTQFLQTVLDTPLFNAENIINTIEQKIKLQRERLKKNVK